MKTSASKVLNHQGEEVYQFRVHQVPDSYSDFFEAEFFQSSGQDFIREFPAQALCADQAAANFEIYGLDAFGPALRQGPVDWRSALLDFLERMSSRGQDIPWLLTGSCALAVRGIEVQPGGLDLVFPEVAHMERVARIFGEEAIMPFCECHDWVALGYGAIWNHALTGMAFETLPCLDLPEPIDSGPAALSAIESVTWMGRRIPVPPLEYSINVNRRRGRLERAELISAFIEAGKQEKP